MNCSRYHNYLFIYKYKLFTNIAIERLSLISIKVISNNIYSFYNMINIFQFLFSFSKHKKKLFILWFENQDKYPKTKVSKIHPRTDIAM